MDLATQLPRLLGLAWLLPLASYVLILFFGPRMGPHGRNAAWVATGAIVGSLVLSLAAFVAWLGVHPVTAAHHGDHAAVHAGVDASADRAAVEGSGESHAAASAAEGHGPAAYAGDWYTLYRGGRLDLSIGWYIDSLTVLMFVVVTFIATCIHVYASGYMHDELHEVTDHEVTLADGHHLHRPGRFPRFFQALSLFCFSMLGIVIAGNLAMVFVFWELVGICSWFLIGFYYERRSASTAANKAFIVNRVGDFGMLIGLMALWGSLGTLRFADATVPGPGNAASTRPGLFSLVRPASAGHRLQVPDGMVAFAAADEVARTDPAAVDGRIDGWRAEGFGRWLLFIAGVGIFCGCVGKSAQFPLFVWLPDAMEGPTPVSALVHSATMVAAGVYLVGRFYPVLTPDVLLVIAYVGAITLFIAATIALVANDIKRVLAYSTVSQLGYMMLALGVGGWVAGLFHLVTHAFFKSLLFLCSGSVIHACHTNDMRRMGGLARVMPATAGTMLVGCLAIIGAGIPFALGSLGNVGLSGFYSKDSILAQAFSFASVNPGHAILAYAVAGGAALTAFYMFRLWFMTFAGEPRDRHVAEHAHESPQVMVMPLIVLAVLAVAAGWTLPGGFGIANLLEQSRPAGTAETAVGGFALGGTVTIPAEHLSHGEPFHSTATWVAFATALGGVLLAAAMYVWRIIPPAAVAAAFGPIHTFLANRWYVDELYQAVFVAPTRGIAAIASGIDQGLIDPLIGFLAWTTRQVAALDAWIDRTFVDGLVNATAAATWSLGRELTRLQTGNLRQYVTFIVAGVVALFVIASLLFRQTFAG